MSLPPPGDAIVPAGERHAGFASRPSGDGFPGARTKLSTALLSAV